MTDLREALADTPLAGVRFRDTGRVHPIAPGALVLQSGDVIIVETEHGIALGTVAPARYARAQSETTERPYRVVKRADSRDLARDEANRQREREAQRICLHRIRERRLSMKLIKVECHFEGSKLTFYFSAEGRVDFRDLVRDLAQTLHTRIEMKQIGARDETKAIGGVGPCGREQCCSCWLSDFEAVSVRMAKDQGLSLNPAKLAGMCGRLKCCLRFEFSTYRELGRKLPAIGASVEGVTGQGIVTQRNVLKQTVLVRREDGSQVEATLDDLVQPKAARDPVGPAGS